jgi:hypothetical protein
MVWPDPPVPEGENAIITWMAAWTVDYGWTTVGVITPEKPVPTPSS